MIARVGRLTTVRFHDGLEGFRPLPTRFECATPKRHPAECNQFKFPFWKGTRFVWRGMVLLLHRSHVTPSFLRRSAAPSLFSQMRGTTPSYLTPLPPCEMKDERAAP